MLFRGRSWLRVRAPWGRRSRPLTFSKLKPISSGWGRSSWTNSWRPRTPGSPSWRGRSKSLPERWRACSTRASRRLWFRRLARTRESMFQTVTVPTTSSTGKLCLLNWVTEPQTLNFHLCSLRFFFVLDNFVNILNHLYFVGTMGVLTDIYL